MPPRKGPPPRGIRPPQKVRPAERPRNSHRSMPPINIRMNSARRKTMPITVALVAALFFIFVVTYMVRAIHTALTPSTAVETVQMGNRDTQRSVMGMIARYEEIIYAPRDGQVSWAVANTERVRRGNLVARIMDVEAIGRISRDRRSIEEEMLARNERRHYTESDPAVQRINNSLHNTISNNMHHFSTLNLAEINTLNNNLENFVETRLQIRIDDSYGAVGGDISRLHGQAMAQYGMNSTNIYATRSGIVFNIVDRYENFITPENMRDLSRPDVIRMVDHSMLLPARDVQAGDPVFKLVSNTWYIVAFIPNNMISGFVEGTDRVIYVQNATTGNYEPMTMRVVYIEPFHTDSRVIFRSTRNVMEFLNQRNVSIRTQDYISRGLQISTSAVSTKRFLRIPLTHVHGQIDLYVHLHDEFGLRQIPLAVNEVTERYVYVPEDAVDIVIGDALIPVSLTEDRHIVSEADINVVHGVYRVIFGVARFTTINIEGELSDTELHILLNPATNPNIRQFDTVVTDASTVSDGDIIR